MCLDLRCRRNRKIVFYRLVAGDLRGRWKWGALVLSRLEEICEWCASLTSSELHSILETVLAFAGSPKSHHVAARWQYAKSDSYMVLSRRELLPWT